MRYDSQNGDDVILELIKKYELLLKHIIELYLYNPVDVDDVYQETVLAILENFRKKGLVEYPKTWMTKITKNKCIDFNRQYQRDTNRDVDLAPFIQYTAFGGGVSIADDQHQTVVVKEIHNVIAEMKSIYKDVGKLHIQGYTACEISESLGIPEGTVKSRIRKFRQLIQVYLEMDMLLPNQKGGKLQ